jgi:hypothetical protein
MAGKYEILLTDDQGAQLANVDDILSMTATRAVNRVGSLVLELPPDFDNNLLRPDNMIQLRRAPTGSSAFKTWGVFFIRKWRFSTTAESRSVKVLTAYDPLYLMFRRIVASYAGQAQSSKIDFADDMMKEVISEAILDTAEPTPAAGTRAWANLSVQADAGDGPLISKSFAWRKLLNLDGSGVLPDLARMAKEAGTEVFFDIVPNSITSTQITFQFQTYIDQPGQDVSADVVFSENNANLKEPFLEFDYTEEEDYIYAAGQGAGAARNVQQVSDSARYGLSIWNRNEGFADARNQTTDSGVTNAGRNRLEDGRPAVRFGGSPQDTKGTRFGRDWDFGDKVTARYEGFELETVVRAVSITLNSDGREAINARFDNRL